MSSLESPSNELEPPQGGRPLLGGVRGARDAFLLCAALAIFLCSASDRMVNRQARLQESVDMERALLRGAPFQFAGHTVDAGPSHHRFLFPGLLEGAIHVGIFTPAGWYALVRLATCGVMLAVFWWLLRTEALANMRLAGAGLTLLSYGLVLTFNTPYVMTSDFPDAAVTAIFLVLTLRGRRSLLLAAVVLAAVNGESAVSAAVIWACARGLGEQREIRWREIRYSAVILLSGLGSVLIFRYLIGDSRAIAVDPQLIPVRPDLYDLNELLLHPAPFSWAVALFAAALPILLWIASNRESLTRIQVRLLGAALVMSGFSAAFGHSGETRVFIPSLVVAVFVAVWAESVRQSTGADTRVALGPVRRELMPPITTLDGSVAPEVPLRWANEWLICLLLSAAFGLFACLASDGMLNRGTRRSESVEMERAILRGEPIRFAGASSYVPPWQNRVLFPTLLELSLKAGFFGVADWYVLLRALSSLVMFGTFWWVMRTAALSSLRLAGAGSLMLAYCLVLTFNEPPAMSSDFIDAAFTALFIAASLRQNAWGLLALCIIAAANRESSAFAGIIWLCLHGLDDARRIIWRQVRDAAFISACSYGVVLLLRYGFGGATAIAAHTQQWPGRKLWRLLEEFLRHPSPLSWLGILACLILPCVLWLRSNRSFLTGPHGRLLTAACVIAAVSAVFGSVLEPRVFIPSIVLTIFVAVGAEAGRDGCEGIHPQR